MSKPKKIFIIILIIALVAILISASLIVSNKKKSAPEFVIAQKMDLNQEVSVTGRVKPAISADLAFEKSGQAAKVEIKVGDNVEASQLLVSLSNADLSAQLTQAELEVENAQWQLAQLQAVQDQEQAKLSELNRGARPEEIQIVETQKSNAQKSLTDAETNLKKVKNLTQTKSVNAQKALSDAEKNLTSAINKADIDLANLYDDVDDILNDAYNKADDAVNKQIDELFINDTAANPQLAFTTTNSQAKIDAEWQRVTAGETIKNFKTEIDRLSNDHYQLDLYLMSTLVTHQSF